MQWSSLCDTGLPCSAALATVIRRLFWLPIITRLPRCFQLASFYLTSYFCPVGLYLCHVRIFTGDAKSSTYLWMSWRFCVGRLSLSHQPVMSSPEAFLNISCYLSGQANHLSGGVSLCPECRSDIWAICQSQMETHGPTTADWEVNVCLLDVDIKVWEL